MPLDEWSSKISRQPQVLYALIRELGEIPGIGPMRARALVFGEGSKDQWLVQWSQIVRDIKHDPSVLRSDWDPFTGRKGLAYTREAVYNICKWLWSWHNVRTTV
jgi:hypothetical protein